MGLFGKKLMGETLSAAIARKDNRAILDHLESTDVEVRIRAVQAISSGEHGAVGVLIGLLDSPDNRIFREAIRALGRVKNPGAVEPLVDLYLGKRTLAGKADSAQRNLIIFSEVPGALAALGDEQAVDLLIAELAKDTSQSYHIFSALVKIGNPKAAEPALGLLKTSEFNKEQSIVGYFQNPETFKDIFTDPDQFEDEQDGLLKSISAGIASLRKIRELQLFYELLRKDDSVLARAAYSIFSGDSGAVEYFVGQLQSSPDGDARQYAVYRLMRYGDVRATEPLLQALKDPDRDVRNIAALALKKLNIQAVPRERETIIHIVKIPCKYCGTLVENTASKCPSCGAPLR